MCGVIHTVGGDLSWHLSCNAFLRFPRLGDADFYIKDGDVSTGVRGFQIKFNSAVFLNLGIQAFGLLRPHYWRHYSYRRCSEHR